MRPLTQRTLLLDGREERPRGYWCTRRVGQRKRRRGRRRVVSCRRATQTYLFAYVATRRVTCRKNRARSVAGFLFNYRDRGNRCVPMIHCLRSGICMHTRGALLSSLTARGGLKFMEDRGIALPTFPSRGFARDARKLWRFALCGRMSTTEVR